MGVWMEATGDGSVTLYNEALKEHYHSTHGAITESRHVFTEAGFRHLSGRHERIRVLEIGFGTGLNALLTLIEFLKGPEANQGHGFTVDYCSLEPYPVSMELAGQFNYCTLLDAGALKKEFLQMHSPAAADGLELKPGFTFRRVNSTLEAYTSRQTFNLVYFDAFSPQTQPELWSYEALQKVQGFMDRGGVFVTYSAKGVVRRALQSLGFVVERLPGPPGKLEFIRATLS